MSSDLLRVGLVSNGCRLARKRGGRFGCRDPAEAQRRLCDNGAEIRVMLSQAKEP